MTTLAMATLIALIAIPVSWFLVAKRLQKKGWIFFFRHLAAGSLSVPTSFSVFALIASPEVGVFLFGFLGVVIYMFIRRWDGRSADQSCPEVVAHQPFKLSPVAVEAYESDDGAGDPLAKLKDSVQKPRQLDTEYHENRIVHGKRLDVIRFEYVNAKGEYSKRRVKVTMVGQWQFEGVDLVKREERTFRHDSVVGSVTSELTGEILEPSEWAKSIIESKSDQ